MASKFVVNADDFGLSYGTNKAIFEAHSKGILTSASLFANGPAFNNALSILKKNPKLGVGAHLSLTIGKPILPPEEVNMLVDKDGYFNNTFLSLFLKSTFNPTFREQIYAEWQAQIELLIKHGLKLDHINGQEHVHMIPAIFQIAKSLSKKNSISILRVSNDSLPFSTIYLLKNIPGISNIVKYFILKILSFFLDYRSDVRFTGIFYTRQMTKTVLLEIFNNLSKTEEKIEVLLHPAYFDISKDSFDYKRQNIYNFMAHENRVFELKALIDKEVITEAKKNILVKFSDL